MRKSLIAATLGAAALTLSGLSPAGAVPTGTGPVGAKAPELARGASHGAFSFPLETGHNVTVTEMTVKPGEIVDWGSGPNSAVVIVKSGTLSNFTSCATKESWSAGGAYFRTSPGGQSLAKNEGGSPADLLVIASDVAGTAEGHDHGATKAEACPTGPAASGISVGAGLAYTQGAIEQQAGEQIAVEVFTIEPGYTSNWHQHPGANMAVQTKGTVDNWQNCKDKEVWTAGNTYFHAPGHHGNHPNLTNNKSDQPAELIAIFFNLPANHPAPVTPISPVPPPAECPTSAFTY
jgi:quercetin dioxygenase-like cupin family protein